MTLTVDIEPEIERELWVKAARVGTTLESYAAEVLRREVLIPQKSVQQKRAALQELQQLATGTREGLPPVDLGDSRSDVYEYDEGARG